MSKRLQHRCFLWILRNFKNTCFEENQPTASSGYEILLEVFERDISPNTTETILLLIFSKLRNNTNSWESIYFFVNFVRLPLDDRSKHFSKENFVSKNKPTALWKSQVLASEAATKGVRLKKLLQNFAIFTRKCRKLEYHKSSHSVWLNP